MNTIYEPSGRAREYSPFALNIYSACDHECAYCYARRMWNKPVKPRKGLIEALQSQLENGELKQINRQVLLSFLCDPYCNEELTCQYTRRVLEILLDADIPVAVLTKGGSRATRDFDIFTHFKRFQLGVTLTFDNDNDSTEWEPGASSPSDRIEILKVAHRSGIRTFVSFEPVIDPEQSLRLMELAAPYTQHYKIGRWNHDHRAHVINWGNFCIESVEFCRKNKKTCYIKDDLAKFAPVGFLTDNERNAQLVEV